MRLQEPGLVVLVVEDDLGLASLLVDVLTGGGYAPSTADSALGAVALARRLRPAVILLDLGLPYRSGGALLGDLKADPATAGVPVLVVSALADALPPARRALAAGVFAKPFSPAGLLAAVRAVVAPAARDPPPRRRLPGVPRGFLGENVAAGQQTPERVVAAWMASPSHQANLLNPEFTRLGVGHTTGGTYGTSWAQEVGAL